MGGHNELPIIIKGNLFRNIFIFFDCQFTDDIIIKNNIFLKGNTLMGKAMNNIFIKNIELEKNIGDMQINQIN
jgi:hypothetical protein